MPIAAFTAVLSPHPDFPAPAPRTITARGHWSGRQLYLCYQLAGGLDQLRLPDPAHPAEPGRLWATSCCEAFLARDGEAAYQEYNFSPSGQWDFFYFSAYRKQKQVPRPPAPPCLWRREDDLLELSVSLPLTVRGRLGAPLALGLAVVVEAAAGGLSYWALRHPPGKPDFHRRDTFALRLTSAPSRL